jgi:prenyl protein peptidase
MIYLSFRYWNAHGAVVVVRNIVVAPITEEVIFRGVIVFLLTATFSPDTQTYTSRSIILRSPLWFSLAHFHHVIDKLRSGEKLFPAVLGTFFQLAYTSIFGAIATVLLIRTGNIWAPIASHMMCNFWGLPNIEFVYPSQKNRYSELGFLYPYRRVLLALHAAGLVIFGLVLYPLSEKFIHTSVFVQAMQK